MKKCKNCSSKFNPKFFNQKYCLKDECIKVITNEALENNKKAKQKAWNNRKAESKKTLKLGAKKEALQTSINKIARMIDGYFNYGCIDCGNKVIGTGHGAHKNNVGSYENLRFNLHNIHKSRVHCNKYSSEHKVGYSKGLKERYGEDYCKYVEDEINVKYKYLGLRYEDLSDALKVSNRIIKDFDSICSENVFKDGKEFRNFLNKKIGIYV